MISPSAALPLSPGLSTMACCVVQHTRKGSDGVQRTIECRKYQVVSTMLTMLRTRREYLLGLGDMGNYRLWTALIPTLTQGLPNDEIPALPQTADDFLVTYHFTNARDEENQGSGVTPLILAGLSGNLVVINELIARHVNVDAKVLIDFPEFGFEEGMAALTLSAALCPQKKVYAVVAALLAAGANPNTATKPGTTPLMAAVGYQSQGGVDALLECVGSRLDLEHKRITNRTTALGMASFTSTTAIVEALVQAGADRKHVEDGGGNKLTDACSNPLADVRMLESLCEETDGNNSLLRHINHPMRARTSKWAAIDLACRNAVRLNAGRSLLVMGRAHCQGARLFHCMSKRCVINAGRLFCHNALGAHCQARLRFTKQQDPEMLLLSNGC